MNYGKRLQNNPFVQAGMDEKIQAEAFGLCAEAFGAASRTCSLQGLRFGGKAAEGHREALALPSQLPCSSIARGWLGASSREPPLHA